MIAECPPIDSRIEKVRGLFSPELGTGQFDVVVMNHILEHTCSPTALLASARDVLDEEGLLVIEVPFELYTPLVARHLGDWRHVGYFCRATLRQFLEKCGFAVSWLALEEGCYGVRRLPVIRAFARKRTQLGSRNFRNSPLVLAKDMFAPPVVVAMLKRAASRR